MIRKVISGGQSGADQGGVKAAKLCGIEPGGTVPKGCLTEFGPMPELLELYNMVEHESDKYPPRTYENAKNSDGTIRFAVNWTTAGEKLTLKAINQYKKPYIDVDPRRPKPVADVVRWVLDHNIKVLNVAGNREKSWRGMEDFVVGYLKEVFTLLKGLERIPDASPFREFFGALRLFRNDHVWYINEDEEIFAEVNGERIPPMSLFGEQCGIIQNVAGMSIARAHGPASKDTNTSRFIRQTMKDILFSKDGA